MIIQNPLFKPCESRYAIMRIARHLLFCLNFNPTIQEDGTISALRVRGLPADVQVVAVSYEHWFDSDDVAVKLWSKEFALLQEGDSAPSITITVEHKILKVAPKGIVSGANLEGYQRTPDRRTIVAHTCSQCNVPYQCPKCGAITEEA